MDKNNKVQGPFSDFHMRQWHLSGYFEPTLQLMNRALPNAQWMMLKDLFPSIAGEWFCGLQETYPPQNANSQMRFLWAWAAGRRGRLGAP